MRRGEDESGLAATVADDEFINDVLDQRAFCADNRNEPNPVSDELLDQLVKWARRSGLAMYDDFLRVAHLRGLTPDIHRKRCISSYG